jgi:hypothetical protein
MAIAFLFAGGASPTTNGFSQTCQPANIFLAAARGQGTAKSRQAEHPLYYGLSPGAELQERAISVPRLILIRRPPTAPALARIEGAVL